MGDRDAEQFVQSRATTSRTFGLIVTPNQQFEVDLTSLTGVFVKWHIKFLLQAKRTRLGMTRGGGEQFSFSYESLTVGNERHRCEAVDRGVRHAPRVQPLTAIFSVVLLK